VIRAVLVDDEPLARRRLRTLLADESDVDVVAECADGSDAVEAIARERPDVVFLDIQMSTLDGLDVARALRSPSPAVVFVTAFDDYAVSAFELSAIDYLLKPFDEERFSLTLARVRSHVESVRTRDAHARLLQFVHELEQTPQVGPVPRPSHEVLRVADIEIDVDAREVRRRGVVIPLRLKLVELLIALARHSGEIVSRRSLLAAVWGYQDDVASRTIDTHMVELRRRLGHAQHEPGYIQTVVKAGYRILL
jgi:DNA-binding response OmpR family regulator